MEVVSLVRNSLKAVFQPRPTFALVKFWQGIVEVCLRAIVIVSVTQTLFSLNCIATVCMQVIALGLLISSAVAKGKLDNELKE